MVCFQIQSSGLQCCWFDLSISAWNFMLLSPSNNNNNNVTAHVFFFSYVLYFSLLLPLLPRVTYVHLQIYTFFASSVLLWLCTRHCSLYMYLYSFLRVNGFCFDYGFLWLLLLLSFLSLSIWTFSCVECSTWC